MYIQKILLQALISRGYKQRSVEAQFNKVRNLKREDAIEKVWKERRKSERVRYVIRYDPRLPDLPKVCSRQHDLLVEDQEMKLIFPERPIVCYQRVQNLGEILTKARLPPKSVQRKR